jgi:peptide/nickel transport system substrate-binding protein
VSPANDANSSLSGVFNPFGSTTPELTKLLAAANAAPDDQQAAAFSEVNKYFVDNAWFAPIAWSAGFWISDKKVKYTAPTQYGVNLLPYAPVS